MHRRLLPAALLTIAVSACGDAPAPDGARSDTTADAPPPARSVSSAPRERAAVPVVVTRDEIDAFVAAWNAAADDDVPTRDRLVAEFAARGDAVFDAVMDVVRGSLTRETWRAVAPVLEKFGAKACLAVARALAAGHGEARDATAYWLAERSAEWRFDPAGPDVCGAVVAAIDASDDADLRSSLWNALADCRPAGRALAADLARRLVTLTTDEREAIAEALAGLGSDAAAAAPLLVPSLRSEDDDVRARARRVLGAIGSADPSILPALREVLATGTPAERRDVCAMLANWGDAAAAAGPDLVALLSSAGTDEDIEAADAAVAALRAMPAIAGTSAVAVLESRSLREGGLAWSTRELLADWAKDPAFATALVRAAPTLSPAAADDLLWVLLDAPGTARVDAASRLLGHAAPGARAYAAEVLIGAAGETASPRILALLDDPVASVRAYTARALAEAHALPQDRLRAVVLALRDDADGDARATAIAALVEGHAVEASDTDWLVRAAHDGTTRRIAVEALATRDGPLPDGLADVAPALARDAIANPACREAAIAWLGRIPRGIETLLDAIPRWFDEHTEAGSYEQGLALDTVTALGPRAALLRERLVVLRAAAGEDAYRTGEVDRALAAIAGDLDAQVVGPGRYLDADEIADLLRRGDAGRLALVLAAGEDTDSALRILGHVPRDTAMQDAVRVASARRSADPATNRTEDIRRTGAARLASILPPAEAADVLERLASDPLADVRCATAETCDTLSERDAAGVPVDALAAVLAVANDDDDDDVSARFFAARAASRLGARADELLPRLREVAASARSRDGLMAAIAAWRVGGHAGDALPAIRRAVDDREPAYLGPWTEVSDALAALPLGDADLSRLQRGLEALELGNYGRQVALIRGLTRFGSRAAPSIPTVRVSLARLSVSGESCVVMDGPVASDHSAVRLADAAARFLVAVGPAARDALPDLRRAASVTTDPNGAVRDAIRRIEAAPR